MYTAQINNTVNVLTGRYRTIIRYKLVITNYKFLCHSAYLSVYWLAVAEFSGPVHSFEVPQMCLLYAISMEQSTHNPFDFSRPLQYSNLILKLIFSLSHLTEYPLPPTDHLHFRFEPWAWLLCALQMFLLTDLSQECPQTFPNDMYVSYYLGIVVEASAVNVLFIITASCEEAQWIEVVMPRLWTWCNQVAGIKQLGRQVRDCLVWAVVLTQANGTQIGQLWAPERGVAVIKSLKQRLVQTQPTSKLRVNFRVHLRSNGSKQI